MSEVAVMNPMRCAGDVVYVKRQGNVCSVFVDPVTNEVQPLSSYEDDPTGGFPITLNTQEVELAFRGKKIIYLEPPKAPLRVAQDALSDGEMQALIDQTMNRENKNAAVELKEGIAPVPVPVTSGYAQFNAQQAAPIQDANTYNVPLLARVEEQFKLLLAKYTVASGKTKSQLKTEIENVASFIIQVMPGSEEMLQQWKGQINGRRFKL